MLLLSISAASCSKAQAVKTKTNQVTEAKENAEKNKLEENKNETKSDISVIGETSSWKALLIVNRFSANMCGFLDKDMSIAVGYNGEIHYSEDGGQNWKTGSNSTLCLFGLAIIDKNTAFACGNGSYVVKTSSGGKLWSDLMSFGESEPNHPKYISFADENNGWIGTTKNFQSLGSFLKLGYSADGGKKWTAVNLPNDAGDIAAVYLRTQYSGYVLDNLGNLYVTEDGGKSFSKRHINLPGADYSIMDFPTIAFTFTDEKNTLIAYNTTSHKLQIMRSRDGGNTFIKEQIPDMDNYGSVYISRDGKYVTSTSSNNVRLVELK